MSEKPGNSDNDFDDIVDAEVVPDIAVPVSDVPTVPDPQNIGPGVSEPGFTEGGVPTFDGVRERIEKRVNTALGAAELDDESTTGRTVAEQFAAREEAARKKLDEIRRSMQK